MSTTALDVSIRTTGAGQVAPSMTFPVAAGATTINPGELVRISSAGSLNVVVIGDGYGVLSTDLPLVGVAQSTSTQTASVAGTVQVHVISPGVGLEMAVKTAGAIDTQAEIDALLGSQRIMDVTSGKQTMDDATASATGNIMVVTGGDPISQRIFVMPKSKSLFLTCGTTTTTA